MKLTFARFAPEHFAEYQSWFDDPDLNRALGPQVDQEWLDCVMSETDGCQYAVCEAGEVVACVGIKFPDPEHPTYTITDIAVKPQRKGRGIGAQVLAELMRLHPCKSRQSWVAFVDEHNPKAKSFLEKCGWLCESEAADEHGMLEMRFTEHAGGHVRR